MLSVFFFFVGLKVDALGPVVAIYLLVSVLYVYERAGVLLGTVVAV